MRWIDDWIRRPVGVLAWATALLLFGGWAALQVPLEWVPQVELPQVTVSASWAGAAPRAVERYVTAPIERAVQGIEGTSRLESTSREGRARVRLSVAEDADLSRYVAKVNDRLAELEEELPDRVQPRLTKAVPEALENQLGFMTLQLVGPLRPDALRRLAEEQVAPKLLGVAGVAAAEAHGGTRREVRVELRPDRLATYGLTAASVRSQVQEAFSEASYGRLRSGPGSSGSLLLRPALSSVEALRGLAVSASRDTSRILHLGDVARVQLRQAPRRSIRRIDGQPVVTLDVRRAAGSPMLEVARSVRERIRGLRAELPEDVRLLVATDRTENVRAQLDDLLWRGGIGFALVLLVLLFMLRSVRAMGVVLFSVAVSLAVALALLGPLGLTLNLVTIAGLTLVFGLLVDNSVVTTEQLLVRRARIRPGAGGGPRARDAAAAEDALRAVWLPLAGGTLSTMAVLGPLVYLSGELRALFLPFGVLVGLTLGASLASAALLVPVLGRFLPPPQAGRRLPRGLRRLRDAPFRGAVRFPRSTLLALILLLGTPLWLLPAEIEAPPVVQDSREAQTATAVAKRRLTRLYNEALGSGAVQEAREVLDVALGGVLRPFFQQVQLGASWSGAGRPPAVRVRLELPSGSPIGRADSLLRSFERRALASEATRRTIARIQQGEERGPVAFLRVTFREGTLQTAEPYVLRQKLIGRAVGLGGVTVGVSGLLPEGYYSSSGRGISGIRIAARGPSYDDLSGLVEDFARRLKEGSRRVATVHTDASAAGGRESGGRQVVTVRWPAAAARRSGISGETAVNALRPALGARSRALRADFEGEGLLPVRLTTEGSGQTDLHQLTRRTFMASDSTRFRLRGLAEVAVETVPAAIHRRNQQYERTVLVDYRGPSRMGRDYVEAAVEAMPVPTGYELEMSRYDFFDEDTRRTFGWLLLAAVGLVFLITAAVFESWRLPAVVLLSLPLALVGVAVGFLWTEASVAEGAFIGGILMVGIAVNDSILLTDRFRQLRTLRPHTQSSLLARLAARERLRPMWTTTLTSVATLLPILLFPQGSDFWTGLSVTVVGGLLASTLLAPLAIVALLALLPSSPERPEDAGSF